MKTSSNCFGLFSEFTLWIETPNDSILVTLKRPVYVGNNVEPNDNDMTIVIDEENECEPSLSVDEKMEYVNFIRTEIREGRLKFPSSIEFKTKDFSDVESINLS